MSNDLATAASPTLSPTAPMKLGHRIGEALAGSWRSVPILVVLVLVWIFFSAQNSAYLSIGNLTNLSLQIVTTATLALGIVFVLLVGEIDLSSAALSGVAAAVAARFCVTLGWPLVPAIGVAIAVAVGVMIVQGLLVIFGIPSLIVTLGGMIVLQGVLLVILQPEFTISVGGTEMELIASSEIPVWISTLIATVLWVLFVATLIVGHRSRAQGHRGGTWRPIIVPALIAAIVIFGLTAVFAINGGIPTPVAIFAVLLLIAYFATTKTRYGVHLYAVGGNREAAKRAGIPVSRIVLYSFIVLGICAAFAGVIDASRVYAVSASSGAGSLMLNAIAAAVVGGTSLFGGRGAVWASVIGALVIGSINNGVQLLGYPVEVQLIATGSVLVLAVAVDVVLSRGRMFPSK